MSEGIIVEVLSLVPPCLKYKKTHEAVGEVIKELGFSELAEVPKLGAGTPGVISKYGIALIPAAADNNITRISGSVANKREKSKIPSRR
ncbi:MAG: hypothetical protein DRO14_04160 [Thermoprotei archaeon]|nr:MAG: hypothetical protein DRO14_04160 [Thermoprotei archaeon]